VLMSAVQLHRFTERASSRLLHISCLIVFGKSCNHDEFRLLGYNDLQSVESQRSFRRNVACFQGSGVARDQEIARRYIPEDRPPL
jgi:hypothetical protein